MRLLAFVFSFIFSVPLQAQHPVAFATKTELEGVKKSIAAYPVLQKSFAEIKTDVDAWLGRDIDVPVPKDPAGGYTHDRHKANYTLMFNSGLLYNLTSDFRYATLVKNLLLKYAKLNPALKNHPQATSSSPGRIFWQALNDANWLVYTGMAYDLVRNSLTADERTKIENGAFKPEVNFLTQDLKSWFNLIHNHGVWACAGVGIVGIATGNKDYVDMALYGTEKDGKAGFLAQLNGLFSPDGYYTEGPYYIRYAILPFYIFANALNNVKPELKIFQYRNSILKKALEAGLQQTNINGRFFPVNDALKEKDFTSTELVAAVDIAWEVYGKEEGLLTVAKKQDRVLLNRGGASIAAALTNSKNIKPYYPYKSVEFTDGAKGNEGGISFLRVDKDANLTTLVFKYASHGLSHGHFDQLGISLFDKGSEILQDYGSARFVNIEQKWGGRYLPENKGYAAQTIAHNTVVVDEKSQFNAKEEVAENYHGEKLFSSFGNPAVQAISAKQENAYPGVSLHRTLYLLQLPEGKKLVVDLFNTTSTAPHQYDLPFQYNGQVIKASFNYKASTAMQKPLGTKNGYQYLWKEAEANLRDTLAQFTFLNKKTYYTISSLITDSAQIIFTRTGANDPDFNLRREPSYIIRKRGAAETFVNVIEVHGEFDPVSEFSTASYPSVQQITLKQSDEQYTVVEIRIGEDVLVIAQCNEDFSTNKEHSLHLTNATIKWTGPFTVLYDGSPLK
ncbi:heparinase II/III domain-containing protein [Flavisolibacter ginsenosidimutans]|uniref:Alginate lyase family protein n=1 Tax=Flavisolibacter ginsenosidimutans TaxID=661481 RepID=A0A5B8UGM1_9BACT|nr:heparinase II/III family protein [Flavisolibacter ginsenosidimutans]QEC55811.1 alginate lyase family protein [Flavisolibacter ginsenosidimutans]